MADRHEEAWFRYEYEQLRNEGVTGDELRLAMYEKGFGYLKHTTEQPGSRKKDLMDVMKMIEYSQGWIDRADGTKRILLQFEQSYKDIILSGYSQHERAVQLGEVMTQMEHHYKIPLVGKERMEKFERECPEVWGLYVTISASRR